MDFIPIALESHGRESILNDICIDRTLGWFTSYYPVILDASRAVDLELTIKIIKESLHQIPDNGIGYGILKYSTQEELKQDITFTLNPNIEFNYLGQFGQIHSSKSEIEILGTIGDTISKKGETGADIIISISIPDNKFFIQIDYNTTRFLNTTIKKFMYNLQEALNNIVTHCQNKTQSTLTPSDVSGNDLSIEELEVLEPIIMKGKTIPEIINRKHGSLYHELPLLWHIYKNEIEGKRIPKNEYLDGLFNELTENGKFLIYISLPPVMPVVSILINDILIVTSLPFLV